MSQHIPGDGRAPFSPTLCVISQFIHIFALSCTSSIVRKILFCFDLAIILHLVLNTTTGNPMFDQTTGGVLIFQALIASHHLALTSNPHETFQPMLDTTLRLPQPSTLAPFRQRIRWAVTLYTNPRGVGWSHQVPHAIYPTNPLTPSRRSFILSKVKEIVAHFAVYQFSEYISIIAHHSPPSTSPLTALYLRALAVLGLASAMYSTVTILHNMLGIFSVVVLDSNPSSWPPLFGNPIEAYTMRRAWGILWHQWFRAALIAHSRSLLSFLHLPQNAFSLLYSVFFISSILHLFGERMMYARWNIHPRCALGFFFMQAVGITLEGAVVRLASSLRPAPKLSKPAGIGRRPKPSVPLRILGYIWVVCWISVTADVKMVSSLYKCCTHFGVIPGLRYGQWISKPPAVGSCMN